VLHARLAPLDKSDEDSGQRSYYGAGDSGNSQAGLGLAQESDAGAVDPSWLGLGSPRSKSGAFDGEYGEKVF